MTVIENFEFPWPIIRVILEGTSILDVPRLELKSMEEATAFIEAYGFAPHYQEDLETIWQIFDDAVGFIEKNLADPEHPKIPLHLNNRNTVKDIRRMLLLASDRQNPDQVYACAILRVMHVLIHLNYDPRLKFFQQMQSQVMARLDKYLYVDSATGTTYLGKKEEGTGIKLLFFKKKDRKDRDREIIKLLHKAESVVEEIYDRVGIRFVTETKLDAIRAVRMLLEKNIISVPNVRPGRSKNRLFDLNRLQFEVDRIETHLQKNPSEPAPYIEKLVKRLEARIGAKRLGRSLLNPHTSEYYKAIQFTCRELVRIQSPLYRNYLTLKEQLTSIPNGSQILAEVFPIPPSPVEFGFFPYEIQIMDVKAYADSIFGKSNHEEYRRKQLEAARRRVFKILPSQTK